MLRRAQMSCVGLVGALTLVPTASGATFASSIAKLTAAERQAMTPSAWRPGCPVGLDDLRMVRASFRTFDGKIRTGRLVVHRDVAANVAEAMRRIFNSGGRIRSVLPIENFNGSDFRSIEADNTSAFNCRYVDGTKRWSQHAFGRAIDINPIENPYVTRRGTTSHRASVPYLKRSVFRTGMAVEGRSIVRGFGAIGWGWGGRWSGAKDYQHFSATGR